MAALRPALADPGQQVSPAVPGEPAPGERSAWADLAIPPVLEQMPREDLLALRYTYKLPSSEANGPNRFDTHEEEARLSVGYPIEGRVLVGVRTLWDSDEATFYGPGGHPEFDFHHLEFDASLGWIVDDDDLVLGTLSPVLNTDFRGPVTLGDWQLFGGALWAHRFGPRFELVAGVAALNDYRRQAQVLPILGCTFQASEAIDFDVLLPEHLQASYRVCESVSTFLRAEAYGGFTSVRTLAGDGRTRFEYQEIRAGPGLAWRVRTGVELRLFGGVLTFREFRRETTDGGEKDVRVDEGAFVSLEVAITPDLFLK